MEYQKNNSSLKAIVVILSILLVGSLAYMYKMSTDSVTTEKRLVSEKDKLIQDLEIAKANYDKAIEENSSLKGDLEAERAKIEQLLAEVKKSKGDIASLNKYKNDYLRLKREMEALLKENKYLREQNLALTSQRDSTNVALEETRKFTDTLISQNENLTKTLERGSKLSILNLRTESFRERSSGKLVSTEKARRVDKIRISFTIAENQIANPGDKLYYVQIIDSKNNVIGEKRTETFGEYTLTYSFTVRIKYNNKTMDVSEMLSGSDFEKGNYYVNIFDRSEIVAKTTFELK